MNAYFSTFTTGFSEIVRAELKKSLKDLKIDLLLDGLVVYRTSSNSEEIKSLKFLNNTYALFNLFKGLSDKPFSDMGSWVKGISEFRQLIDESLNKDKKLKLIFVEKNQYIHLDKIFVNKLIESIEQKTKVIVDRYNGEEELWFLVRSEGYGVIGLRLTNHSDNEKTLQKGELRPEIAYLMSLMSDPKETDILFDPFAGHGSIPQQLLSFPHNKIIAGEMDKVLVDRLEKKFGNAVAVDTVNALSLSTYKDNSIDKIVTDPPWGLFGDEKINIGSFYPQMLKEFYRIMKPGGMIILLISQTIDLERVLNKFPNKYKLEKKLTTLVNGQKASVYKLIKI